MSVEEDLQEFFIKNNLTLSLAESITGGGVASKLISIPDCSNYFLGSVVAYANRAKKEILGVKGVTLASLGAVSEEVACEMAFGALKCFSSSYALATTGIAGPSGGSDEKPVGTVSFAIVGANELTWTAHFSGNRKEIIEKATSEALQKLLSTIMQK